MATEHLGVASAAAAPALKGASDKDYIHNKCALDAATAATVVDVGMAEDEEDNEGDHEVDADVHAAVASTLLPAKAFE